MALALVPSSTFSRAELAALFTEGYEDYYTPAQVDEAAFSYMVDTWDIDLDASRVAIDGDERIGFVNLGVRGEEAWIGGIGIVVPRRGEGIGRMLMDAAHEQAAARGVRRVWLEVLVQNERAIALYERLGYRRIRDVEVWTLDGGLGFRKREALPLAVEDAVGREERPPWQRADATVAHVADAAAIGDKTAVLIYRFSNGVASLLQCTAPDADAAADLLAALPEDVSGVRWLNGPEGHPLNVALAAAGATLAHRQHELLLDL